MTTRLRDFIRNIRSCSTAAEERAVISKECALIRNAFKEGEGSYRHRNLAKLLFIHMMGYPTHFAQIECLKLIASNRFTEKRIGYLGLTQFLDENTELLMLVTNSIKNDLNHQSQYINGLALTALGNIATAEMCQSLAKEVEKLCVVHNPYIRKKALLCAIRLVRKVEDINERFYPIIRSLFEEKNHGVLVSGCSLICALVETDQKNAIQLLKNTITPLLLVSLKRMMLMSGYSTSAEYDISGVTDPFLQIKLLRTIKILNEGGDSNDEIAEAISQIASSTDTIKGVGSAVLLECANTVLTLKGDNTLTTLGVSILGRFLSNKDCNIRYVALSALQKVIKVDKVGVLKHKDILIECLKDTDTSIRRRALEVIYSLINDETIKIFLKELLSLLLDLTNNHGESDFIIDLTSKICTAIEMHAPTRRWQIDSLIEVFTLAGDSLPLEVWNNFICLIVLTPQLQSYIVRRLYITAKENKTQPLLVAAAIWAIGEYGDLISEDSPSSILNLLESFLQNSSDSPSKSLLRSLESLSPTHSSMKNLGLIFGGSRLLDSSNESKGFIEQLLCTCLVKLSARFEDKENKRIISIMRHYFSINLSIELQQRANEYEEILENSWDHKAIFDKMPLIGDGFQQRSLLDKMASRPVGDVHEELGLISSNKSITNKATDLNSILGELVPKKVEIVKKENVEELLADIFDYHEPIASPKEKINEEPESKNELNLDSLI